MQLCNLSHIEHPARVADERVQTDGTTLRARGYGRSPVRAAGPRGAHCGTSEYHHRHHHHHHRRCLFGAGGAPGRFYAGSATGAACFPERASATGAGFSLSLGCGGGEAEPVLPFPRHAAAVEKMDVANPSDLAGLPWQPVQLQLKVADLGVSVEGGQGNRHLLAPQSPRAFAWSIFQGEGQDQDWKRGAAFSLAVAAVHNAVC